MPFGFPFLNHQLLGANRPSFLNCYQGEDTASPLKHSIKRLSFNAPKRASSSFQSIDTNCSALLTDLQYARTHTCGGFRPLQ